MVTEVPSPLAAVEIKDQTSFVDTFSTRVISKVDAVRVNLDEARAGIKDAYALILGYVETVDIILHVDTPLAKLTSNKDGKRIPMHVVKGGGTPDGCASYFIDTSNLNVYLATLPKYDDPVIEAAQSTVVLASMAGHELYHTLKYEVEGPNSMLEAEVRAIDTDIMVARSIVKKHYPHLVHILTAPGSYIANRE